MSEAKKAKGSPDYVSEGEADELLELTIFKEHFADNRTPAVLKDWTANDFASLYVRFRPHLETYARRFLANSSQVEEVVQDAFLYLMTSLPELDSELGVLRFLKWKVRLLALDVIRVESRRLTTSIEEIPYLVSEEPEISQGLERADDAALVALALSKLNARQREVIIATLYEGKSNEVVASQMGLNENALRQLLFRAREAFKSALVGDLDTRGLTVSQILSVAVRKAAQESGRGVVAILVTVSFMGGVTIVSSLLNPSPERSAQSAAQLPKSEEMLPSDRSDTFANDLNLGASEIDENIGNLGAAGEGANAGMNDSNLVPIDSEEAGEAVLDRVLGADQGGESTTVTLSLTVAEEERRVLLSQLNSDVNWIFGNTLDSELNDGDLEIDDSHASVTIATLDGKSNRLNLGIRPDMSKVEFLFIENTEFQIVLAPSSVTVFEERLGEDRLVQIAATDFLAGDLSGEILNLTSDTSSIFGSYLLIQIHLNAQNVVLDSGVLFKTPVSS